MKLDIELPECCRIVPEGPALDSDLHDALALLRHCPEAAQAHQLEINQRRVSKCSVTP
jgi:hypothetical protein